MTLLTRSHILWNIQTIIVLIMMCVVVAEPISKTSSAAKGLNMLWLPFTKMKCLFTECCDESWIHGNIAHKLQREVDEKLYGQHIAQEYVIRGVRAHVSKARPNKALVMSFHGWTGSGKNYVAKMIAKSIFKNEMHSKFVHLFVATLHFPHPEEVDKYKEQLRSWIYGNLTQCERSLFIFDEIDKMPYQLMDVILPFIDYHEQIGGVDPRKSIFLFLSNGGMNAIVEKTLEYYHSGRSREEITYKEMEDIIKNSAYNEGWMFIFLLPLFAFSGDGGLKTSRLISKHVIDYFVPFLPLERKHVIMCFKDYLRSRGFPAKQEEIEDLANQLHFFPKASPIYSVSGCKSIEQKVDFLYSEYVEKQHFLDDL